MLQKGTTVHKRCRALHINPANMEGITSEPVEKPDKMDTRSSAAPSAPLLSPGTSNDNIPGPSTSTSSFNLRTDCLYCAKRIFRVVPGVKDDEVIYFKILIIYIS